MVGVERDAQLSLFMTLEQRVERMPEERRWALALRLLSVALPIWEVHTSGRPIEYRDSVVGLAHEIAPDLLRRSIASMTRFVSTPWFLRRISARRELLRIKDEFTDPIVSLKDSDFDPHVDARVLASVAFT